MEWVAIAMATVSTISSIVGGSKASSATKSATNRAAIDEQAITTQKIKELRQDERTLAGQTRVRAAASGVKANVGSPLDILAEQARTFAEQRLITSQVGATKMQAGLARGRMVGQQAMYQGISQGAQSLTSAFSMFANTR